jgi:putative ABC transport system permease protein
VLERLQNIPGVDGVALIDWLPLVDSPPYASPGFTIVGQGVSTAGPDNPGLMLPSSTATEVLSVSSGYFRLMGIPVMRGRAITEQDSESNTWVVVINEAMARRFWPNEDSIGRVIKLGDSPEEKPRQIVGIVGNVKQLVLTRDPQPEAYVSYQQLPWRIYPGCADARVHKSLILRTPSMPRRPSCRMCAARFRNSPPIPPSSESRR